MKHGPSLVFRLTVYPLVLLIFAVICAFVVYFAAGYNIKFENGRFVTEKTGIIIVATRPGEAVVILDGEMQPQKTPSMTIFNLKIKRVISGTHRLIVSKEGYETWEGDVTVEPGLVSWRDYLVLVSLERKSEPYNIPGSVEGLITSRDHRRAVAFASDRTQNLYSFWGISLENKTSFKISEGSLLPDEKIELLTVSDDSSKYLYKRTNPTTKQVSFLVAEIKENGNSSDLSSLFSNQADNYYFSPSNTNELYFTQQGAIYKINTENQTESAVLLKDVVGIYPLDGQLLLARKLEGINSLWTLGNNNEAVNLIKSLPEATGYDVSYLKGSKSYLIRSYPDNNLLLYNSASKEQTPEIIARNVSLYRPGAQGYSVAFYTEATLQVYDIPEKKYYTAINSDQISSFDWVRGDKNIIYSTGTYINLVNYNGDYSKGLFAVTAPSQIIVSQNNHNLLFTNIVDADKDIFSFSL